jgi:hypothetical protein
LFDLNNRINRAYTAMYNKDSNAYAWCGLAALASSHGGQGIAMSELAAGVLKLANNPQ